MVAENKAPLLAMRLPPNQIAIRLTLKFFIWAEPRVVSMRSFSHAAGNFDSDQCRAVQDRLFNMRVIAEQICAAPTENQPRGGAGRVMCHARPKPAFTCGSSRGLSICHCECTRSPAIPVAPQESDDGWRGLGDRLGNWFG